LSNILKIAMIEHREKPFSNDLGEIADGG